MEGLELIRSHDVGDYMDWLSEFYADGMHAQYVSLWVRHFVRDDGLPVRMGGGDENAALVYENEFVTVHLRRLSSTGRRSTRRPTVSTSPISSIMIPIAGGQVEYVRYTIEGCNCVDEFSRNATIRENLHGVCGVGHILEVKKGGECMRIDVPSGEAFVLQLSIKRSERLIWTFDIESGRALFAASSSVEATRVQLICRAIAEMGVSDGSKLLCSIARYNEFHFVRMEAIRALFVLGYPDIYSFLQEMANNDMHSHVRKACQDNLDKLTEGV